MMLPNSKSLYLNQGNHSILQFLDDSDMHILDVGCGAGDTGSLILSNYPASKVTGITCSLVEHKHAMQKLSNCLCMDIERDIFTCNQEFDVILFSHVLEHLIDPVAVISKLIPYLKIGGKVIIALPNIANWRDRIKITLGKFEYTDGGVMDRTHLHFYTFHTAARYLVEPISQLKLIQHTVNGHIPLGLLRHNLINQDIRQRLDLLGCRWMPNLFGHEILIKAVKLS